MKTLLTILLGFSAVVTLQAEEEVIRPIFSENVKNSYNADNRIVGGYPAFVGQFPWQALVVQQVGDFQYWCGGVLISTHWVLTISYCMLDADLLLIAVGGITTLIEEEGRIEVRSTNYIVRPHNYTSDVGLIYLRYGVELNDRIRPIRLPQTSEDPPVGSRLILSGYGRRTDNTSDPSGLLHYVQLTTISNPECTAIYGGGVTEIIFCTKGDPLNSPCYGDAGGPLVLYDGVEEPTLYGLSAFMNAGGCSTIYPAGHVNVAAVSDWIRVVTGIQ